jgi:flagellar biosynthesis protein FliR
MQVLVTGAPVKVAVGLVMLAASLPTTAMLMQAAFRNLGASIATLLGG